MDSADNPTPVCLIPARGGSKRIPRKNIREINGKPLLGYALEAAKEADLFGDIWVSSDDEEILGVARQHGATELDHRPDQLASDNAQVVDVCLYLLRKFQEEDLPYTDFCLLLTTNPLRSAQDVQDAYEQYRKSSADFLMSVRPFHHPPQRAVRLNNGLVEPFFGREKMIQTQKLEPLYRHDGSVFWADIDAFLEQKTQYGESVAGYEMPPDRSVDIDEPIDLEWAEFLMRRSENE